MKNIFREGAIGPDQIAKSIAAHQPKTGIGAHSLFLGQVRADKIDGKMVTGIRYECYEEMANKLAHEIREAAFEKFELTCMHIYHSTGLVKTGEIGFVVFVSSPHRQACFDAQEYLVNRFKAEVPIFGVEILEDGTEVVKQNRS